MNTLVAIDPGAGGGIAYQLFNGKILCRPMPETEGDIVAAIRHASCLNPSAVVMEQVGGFIAGKFNPGSAMFNFGMNYGILKGSIQALGMPLVLVRPQAWQKALSLGTKKDHENKWKNHLKERAQQLFPQVENITLKTADALLILHYAIKQNL